MAAAEKPCICPPMTRRQAPGSPLGGGHGAHAAPEHRPQRQGPLLPPGGEPGRLPGQRQGASRSSRSATRARTLSSSASGPATAAASTILDRVFLAEPADTFYAVPPAARHRGHPGLPRPEETCFCQPLASTRPTPAATSAAWMTRTHLYLSANTAKGRGPAATLAPAGGRRRCSAVEAQKAPSAPSWPSCPWPASHSTGLRRRRTDGAL